MVCINYWIDKLNIQIAKILKGFIFKPTEGNPVPFAVWIQRYN